MSGYDFDQLIKDGKTTEALRYFAKEGYDNGAFGHTRKQLVEHAAKQIEILEFKNYAITQELNHVDAKNKKHRELLESIRYTENVASEIFKTTDKKVISPDDLLQHILRKVNKFLEESE